MKNIYLILLCVCLFWACQKEEDSQIINNSDALNRDSPLTSNLKRLTQNPTTFDNFIDGSSKIRLELPAQMTINNDVIFSLNTTSDYSTLIEILEDTPNQDNINLNFPVNMSTIDYSMVTISSNTELDQLLQSVSASSEVNCISLEFPVDIQFFDASNSFVDSQTITNDAQFFNFLVEVDNYNLFYDLQFPVTVSVDAGPNQQFQTIVNSNSELNAIYNELPESCFDPLLYDNQPSDNNPTSLEELVQFITDGNFEISELIDEGEVDNTYEGLLFNFESEDDFDGNILVDGDVVGTWTAYLDDSVIVFEMDFDDSFYGELDEDWDVLNIDDTSLELQDESSDGDTSTLVFSKVD